MLWHHNYFQASFSMIFERNVNKIVSSMRKKHVEIYKMVNVNTK